MKGHIRQRSKGSWSVVLYLGRDARGKPVQRWHTVHGTKQDAEREQARLVHELDTGSYVEPSRVTVAEHLERWLEDSARLRVQPKTYERYSEIVRQHLIPALGHHRLDKLRPMHIASYYSDALASGRKDGKGGLSARTVLHHHRVLHTALRQAVRWQCVARNVADAVEPPRPARSQPRVLDEAGTAQLVQAASGTPYAMPVMLALATGLRRGELLALRWENVDFEAGTLRVVETLEQTKQGVRPKEPKTGKSRRTVAIGPTVIEELRRHRAEQIAARLRLGPAFNDHALAFPKEDGNFWPPDSFTIAFRAFARSVGFERLSFHSLRHTHATHLLRHNTHPKIVSERLGHSTIGITLDTYSHVVPGMQDEAARKADETLRAALGDAQKGHVR